MNKFSVENIQNKLNSIEKKFKNLKKVLSRDKWTDLDRMFFSFESLPIRGKEYWFMLFTSNDTENKKQFMVTFGDQNIKNYVVDDCKISDNYSDKNKRFGPFSYWFFNNSFFRSKTRPSVISMESGNISLDSVSANLEFSGSYPNYNLVLKDGKKSVCDIRTSRGSDHREYDLMEFFKGKMGFGHLNLLLDFEGKLDGSKFNGQCYLQKVVINALLPNVPWYWGRLYFSDKSVLSYLQPHIKISKISKKFGTSAYYHDSKSGKNYYFDDVKVRKFGNRNKQFLVHGSDKRKEFTLLTENYAQKNFKLNFIGELSYEQNLVKVKSFSLESGDELIKKEDGLGIAEDATGYVI